MNFLLSTENLRRQSGQPDRRELQQSYWREQRHIYENFCCFNSQVLEDYIYICVCIYIYMWLQKEDIAETAVHFVLKWGFEVNPVSNNSRMLETDFGDIPSAKMPLKLGL